MRSWSGRAPRLARVTAGISVAVALITIPGVAGATTETARRIPPGRGLRASSLGLAAAPSPYRIRRIGCPNNGTLLTSSGPTVIIGLGGDGGDANRARGGKGGAFVVAVWLNGWETMLAGTGCAGESAGGTVGGPGAPNGGRGGFAAPGNHGAGGGGSTWMMMQLAGPERADAGGGGGAGAGGPAGGGGDAGADGGGGGHRGRAGGNPGSPDGALPFNGEGGEGGPQSPNPLRYGAGGGGGGAPSGGAGGSSLISSKRAAGGGGGGTNTFGAFPSGFTASYGRHGHGAGADGAVLVVTAKPPVRAPYWPGWDIVRGVATHPRSGGYVLDGFGGLHRFGQGADPRPPVTSGGPYWSGIDIARGVAVLPGGTGGFVVDGWGGLHGFSIGGHAKPVASGGPYWAGRDIARGVSILPDGSGGYVVDGFGGLHRFGINGHALPPVSTGPYFPGENVVRGVTSPFADGGRTGGYIGLSSGEVFPWGRQLGGWVEPAEGYPLFDSALGRGVANFDGALGGLVVDGFGGLHPFASPALP